MKMDYFFAINKETVAVQHHISKNFSHFFILTIEFTLAKSFLNVGTQGAIDKKENTDTKNII